MGNKIKASIKRQYIQVSGIQVEVVRKAIKNLHLGVYPPSGRVRVAAPLSVSDDAVRLAVISRLSWIKKHQAKFAEQQRQSEREYISGECHYYLGQRFRLNVASHTGPSQVALRSDNRIDLLLREGTANNRRKDVLQSWYRKQLRALADPLIRRWAERMTLPMPEWGIKRMKTKWGSCNITDRRIWLNLELIKKPPQCLEYVIVHELVHFFERYHNAHFAALMDHYMPHWRNHRDELNAAPLRQENWD